MLIVSQQSESSSELLKNEICFCCTLALFVGKVHKQKLVQPWLRQMANRAVNEEEGVVEMEGSASTECYRPYRYVKESGHGHIKV